MERTLLQQQQQLWHKALRHSAWLFVKEGLAIVERKMLFSFLWLVCILSTKQEESNQKKILMRTITLLIQAFLVAVLSTYATGHQCAHDFHQARVGKKVPAIHEGLHHGG